MSEAQKQMKAESLIQKAAMGMRLNPAEVTRRVLEAEGHDDIEALMSVPEAQPDPEVVLKSEEFKHKRDYEWAELKANMVKNQYENLKDFSQAMANLARAAATEQGMQNDQIRMIIDSLDKEHTQLVDEMNAVNQLISTASAAQQQPQPPQGEQQE